MAEVADIWKHLLASPSPKAKSGNSLLAEKIKLLNSLPLGIITGKIYAKLTREELERCLAPARDKLSASMYIRLLRFLVRNLEYGRKIYSWDLSLPALPIGLLREPARFTPLKFKELNNLRRLEAIFLRSLSSGQIFTSKHRLGQMLFSAILYGGLLDRQWLEPWLASLSNRVRVNGNAFWFEMQRFWQYQRESQAGCGGTKKRSAEKPIVMTRRWFADPMTKCLVIRWKSVASAGEELSVELPNAYDLVKDFLLHAGATREDIPETAGKLVKMAEIRLGLTVSPFLASYAVGSVKAVSLAPEVWARLCSGKLVGRKSDLHDTEKDAVTISGIRSTNVNNVPVPLYKQEFVLQVIKSVFSVKAGEKLDNAYLLWYLPRVEYDACEEKCHFIDLLLKWLYHLLAQKSRYKPSTIRRYLGSIANILLVVFENENPMEFEAGDFIERYDRAIELVKRDKEKSYARQTIGRFHEFMVRNLGVPRIYQGFFSGRSGPPETTVDANLLSQVEFDRLKAALGWADKARPRIATAALLAAILGFRCGLRRNEVLYIRTRDIQWGSKPELVLRVTSKRSLKTPSSTRRVPLFVLLQPDELDELKIWLIQYADLGPELFQKSLVFSQKKDPSQVLPDSLVFNPIREALVMVTGDSTLRFHHLRHSFVTWLLIRLTGSGNGLRAASPFLNHPEFEGGRVSELRSALLANENMGRKGAYAVAQLCGHADIETTFTSYVHLCDWLLGWELSRPEALPRLPVEVMIGATGLSRATVYRATKSNTNKSDVVDWDWDKLISKTVDSRYRDPYLDQIGDYCESLVSYHEKQVVAGDPLWKTVQKALYLIQVRGKSVQQAGESLGVDVAQIDKWLTRVAQITSIRHNILKKSDKTKICIVGKFRHVTNRIRPPATRLPKRKRIEGKELWKLSRNRTRTHFFPRNPVEKGDQALAEMILNNFENLKGFQQNEVMVMVDYFLETFSIHKGMIAFSESRHASEFIAMLELLGIPKTSIQLVDMSGAYNALATVNQRLEWEKTLKMNGCSWAFSDRGYGGKKNRKPNVIGIRVLSQVNDGMVSEGSYGFRYAMYILAIGYWS